MGITIDNSDSLTCKGTGLASIKTSINIAGSSTNLPITITADFNNIPVEQHEVYLQAFVYQYNRSSEIYDVRNYKPENIKSNVDKIVELICNPKNWKLKRK